MDPSSQQPVPKQPKIPPAPLTKGAGGEGRGLGNDTTKGKLKARRSSRRKGLPPGVWCALTA